MWWTTTTNNCYKARLINNRLRDSLSFGCGVNLRMTTRGGEKRGHWLEFARDFWIWKKQNNNKQKQIPCLTKKYGESGTKMTPTRTSTGKRVQIVEIQRQSYHRSQLKRERGQKPKNTRVSSKTHKIIQGAFVFFLLTRFLHQSGQTATAITSNQEWKQ